MNGHGHACDCHGPGGVPAVTSGNPVIAILRQLRSHAERGSGSGSGCGPDSSLEFLLPVAGDAVLEFNDFRRRFLFPAVIDRKRATGLERAVGSAGARPGASAFTELVRPRPACPYLLCSCEAYLQDEIFPDGSCRSITFLGDRKQAGTACSSCYATAVDQICTVVPHRHLQIVTQPWSLARRSCCPCIL